MMDFFLRADTQEEIDSVIAEFDLLTEGFGEIDRIGMNPQRITDYATDPPTIKTMDGYHANLRLFVDELSPEAEAALDQITIAPPNLPLRVWA